METRNQLMRNEKFGGNAITILMTGNLYVKSEIQGKFGCNSQRNRQGGGG